MEFAPYMVPIVATTAVAAVGLIGIPRVHRDAPEPSSVPSNDQAGLKVLALGFPGSGKTALLAAMFHTLSREGRHGVTVRTDPAHPQREDQQDQLNDMANRFEELQTVLPYPNPRRSLHRYALAFCVAGPLDQHQPIRFHYLDYSGELLRDSFSTPGLPPVLSDELASADVILGLVDGAKVAAMMRTGPDDASLAEVRHLVKLLHDHRDKVIQLVVTKWDLLAADRTLEEVIAWLERRITRFQDLRRSDRDSPVRLIPASAFGLNGFMQEREPGQIRRDPALTWAPFQAGHPVACGVNEVLRHGIHRLTGPDGAPAAFTSASVSPFLAWAMKVLGLVTVSTDLSGNVQFSLNLNALDQYQAAVAGPPVPPVEVSRDTWALQLILRHCRGLADELDQAFPNARPR